MPHGHFWVAIGDATAPYTVFHFTTGYDAATGPDRFLGGLPGLRARGLPVAVQRPLRRRGDGTSPVGLTPAASSSTRATPGAPAVEFIHQLYHVEHQLPPPDTPEHIAARHAVRQSQAIPILNDLKAWLDATLGTALPKSAVAVAIRYADEPLGGVRPVHRGRAAVARQ